MATLICDPDSFGSEVIFVQNPDEPSGLADKLSVTEWAVTKWSAEAIDYMPTKHSAPLSGFHLLIHAERDERYCSSVERNFPSSVGDI
jgi:hypothetical protein